MSSSNPKQESEQAFLERIAFLLPDNRDGVEALRLAHRFRPRSYAAPAETDIDFLQRLADRPSWTKDRKRMQRIIRALRKAGQPSVPAPQSHCPVPCSPCSPKRFLSCSHG